MSALPPLRHPQSSLVGLLWTPACVLCGEQRPGGPAEAQAAGSRNSHQEPRAQPSTSEAVPCPQAQALQGQPYTALRCPTWPGPGPHGDLAGGALPPWWAAEQAHTPFASPWPHRSLVTPPEWSPWEPEGGSWAGASQPQASCPPAGPREELGGAAWPPWFPLLSQRKPLQPLTHLPASKPPSQLQCPSP